MSLTYLTDLKMELVMRYSALKTMTLLAKRVYFCVSSTFKISAIFDNSLYKYLFDELINKSPSPTKKSISGKPKKLATKFLNDFISLQPCILTWFHAPEITI